MAEFEPEEGVVYIGSGVKITGAILAQETVAVDGSVEGEIACRRLLVGPHGVVDGQIDASEAQVRGEIIGSIRVKQLFAVQSSARIKGNWLCGEMLVERGALLNGVAGDERLRAGRKADAEDLAPLSRPSAPEVAESREAAAERVRPIRRLALRPNPGRK